MQFAVGFWMTDNLDLVRELKESVEHECDGDTNCSWCVWNGPQRIGEGIGTVQNQKKKIQTTALLTSARILRRVLET